MHRLGAVVSVLAASLCACGENPRTEMARPYVGTWTIASGNDTANCGQGPQTPTPLTGSVFVNGSSPAGTVSVRDSNHGNCLWTLRATNASATFLAGAECSATVGGMNEVSMNEAIVNPVDYTLILLSNNEAAVESTFDWTILEDTCRHVERASLLLMDMGVNNAR